MDSIINNIVNRLNMNAILHTIPNKLVHEHQNNKNISIIIKYTVIKKRKNINIQKKYEGCTSIPTAQQLCNNIYK